MVIKNNNNQGGRRVFIKKALATGAALTGIPSGLWARPGGHQGAIPAAGQGEPPGKGYTILFQGDSITDGNRSRNTDWNHVLGHGYAYLISSRLWFTHTERNLHFFNRGISGNKVTDLADRWQEDTLAIKPDLLSILVGVNDADSMFANNNRGAVPAARYEEIYSDIIKKTKEVLPGIQLVICEPFILPVGKIKDNWEAWLQQIKPRQAIAKKLAAANSAVFIELQEAFNKACKRAPADYWIWDGIHPMPAGHELIAREWINKVSKHCPAID